jgi:hypothetical protein
MLILASLLTMAVVVSAVPLVTGKIKLQEVKVR